MKKKTKIILSVLVFLALLFFIFAGIVIYFASALIDNTPFEIKQRDPDQKALISAAGKFQLQFREDTVKDSLSAFLGLSNKFIVLEFTEDEVNALIDSAIAGQKIYYSGKSGEETHGIYDLYFKEGAFTILYSKKLKISTPFGSYLNIRVVVVPGIKDGHYTAQAHYCSVGSIKLPASLINKKISQILPRVEENEKAKAVLKVVSELKVEDGKLKVSCRPAEFSMFLLEYSLNKLQSL